MNNKIIILIFSTISTLSINSGCNSCKKGRGISNNKTVKVPNPTKPTPSKKSKPKIVNPEVPEEEIITKINGQKDENKHQSDLGEIESIYEKTPDLIDENIDISNVQLSKYNKEDLEFSGFNAEFTGKAFNKTIEFIRKLIKKRGFTGNFKVEKVVSENTGKNSLKKLKITSQSGQSFHLFCKRDNTCYNNQTENMLKCFKKINLLPFNYYYDPETSIIITEDVTEKGYKFLDFEYDVITEKNKQIWNECKNINEFRFWCYILKSDDIDPMYKYDNCCFEDNKVYALDLRYANLADLNKYASNYSDFFRYLFKSINTNEIHEEHKNTDHYKTWEQSINDFIDFTDEEKKDINEKIVDLLIYVTKLLKQTKGGNDILMLSTRDYLNNIIDKIYYFFEDYVKKYSVKNGKIVFGKYENLNSYLRLIGKIGGYSYENLQYKFNEYIKNDIDFNSILTKETVCKIFDIYCHSVNDDIFYNKLSSDTFN